MCQFSEQSFGLSLQSSNNDNNDNKSALLQLIFKNNGTYHAAPLDYNTLHMRLISCYTVTEQQGYMESLY